MAEMTPQEKASFLEKLDEVLRSEEFRKLFAGFILSKAVDDLGRALGAPGYTPEAQDAVDQIASETGMLASEVILRAMRLYRLALEAERVGHRLAILTGDDEIVRYIVGLGPVGS